MQTQPQKGDQKMSFDTENTKYPVCPHCGHEDVDNCLDMTDDGVYKCEKCGEDFYMETSSQLVYTTTPETTIDETEMEKEEREEKNEEKDEEDAEENMIQEEVEDENEHDTVLEEPEEDPDIPPINFDDEE